MKRKRSKQKKQSSKNMKIEVIDLVTQVFGNDLIIRHLEKMLSLTDLKTLRLVNRQLNSTVISRTSFTSRICITVNKELISSRVLENMSFPINAVRVECFLADSSRNRMCRKGCVLSNSDRESETSSNFEDDESSAIWERVRPSKVWLAEEIEHIYNSLEHVEALDVYCPDSEFSRKCFCDGKFPGSSFQLFPSVNRIIQNSKTKVKKLKLHSKWLRHVLEDYDESLRPHLKEMNHLDIDSRRSSKIPKALLGTRRLEYLKLGEFSYFTRTAEDEEIIELLIKSNVKSLQALAFHGNLEAFPTRPSKILARIRSSRFPNLRKVDIKFEADHARWILELLRSHKDLLESLTLKLTSYRSPVPPEIVAFLPTLSNLKEFCLFSKTLGNYVNLEQFAVLKRCTGLQTLRIELESGVGMFTGNGMRLPEMFNHVPVSVKHLGLIGCYSHVGPPLLGLSIGTMTNLRSLRLIKCYEDVSNETLQAIFSKLTLLKELVLTHAIRCNSEGFLGDDSPESASIKNLTDLEKLVLHDCSLTDAAIYKVFEFPKLKLLDVSGKNLTPTLRLRYILTRNPLLEVLRLGKGTKSYSKNQLIELKKFHPSLRQLQVKCERGRIVIIG